MRGTTPLIGHEATPVAPQNASRHDRWYSVESCGQRQQHSARAHADTRPPKAILTLEYSTRSLPGRRHNKNDWVSDKIFR